jgi:parallel beta-helix repeat protein
LNDLCKEKRTMTRLTVVLVVLLGLWPMIGLASEFYVDPENGNVKGDGSAANPWRSLQTVIDAGLVQTRKWAQLPYKAGCKLVPKNSRGPVKGGDTIWLRSGYYGRLYIDQCYNTANITLAAEEGHTPRFSRLEIRASSHWIVKGLAISAEYATPPQRKTLVDLKSHSWGGPASDVSVMDCTISSAADTSFWSAEDWNDRSCDGCSASGTRMKIIGNRLRNVNFGIVVGATHSLVQDNLVENFSADGLRGLGSYTTFQYNTVRNCYNVNGNHDDGFQSWTRGRDGVGTGEVKGIVLRGNTIINNEDPNQPHKGTLQGIGCFDGTYVDWIVENNVVIVNHYHGITLLGARNCIVRNNTVIDIKPGAPGPPLIRIGKHKNGTPPVKCVIANNLATSFRGAAGVIERFNYQIKDPQALFVDVDHFNLRLRQKAQPVDIGSNTIAPELDRDRISRPQGRRTDIGAYEWHTEDVQPVEDAL